MMVSSVSVVVIDDKGNNSAILSKLHQKVLDVAWEVAAYTNLCFVFRGDRYGILTKPRITIFGKY